MISSSRLRFAELIGSTTSALLQSIENTKQLKKSIRAEKMAFQMEQEARTGAHLQDLVREHADTLMDMVGANGLLLVLGEDRIKLGSVPKKPLEMEPLRARSSDGVATTSHLSSVVDMDARQKQMVAGAALLDLSEDGRDYIVFLRRSFDQTIQWAGKPEKIKTRTESGGMRLSPRGSFELWQEERRGKSRPFDALDLDALRILRRALFALNSMERERHAREAQKSAEAEETRLRHALLDAARASSMGELASAIAHELNQPLSAVANFVSACRQEFKNAGVDMPHRAVQLIEDAVAETARAGDLVHRVRNFISKGDLNADYIDLNACIKQGVDLALVSNELSRLQVNMILAQDLPHVLADGVQIGQVVLNLVRNSLNAMEESSRQILTVEVLRFKDFAQVHIRDTGCGIQPDQHKYLFEPFHSSTTNGMGIGLSLCRSIVEAHGGKIWSQPVTKGAAFVFQLPIQGTQDGSS